MFAGAGNDWIDGGEGRDQLVFMGSEGWITPEHFYVVSYNGVTVPIPDAVAQPQVGTDKLVNVETLLFSSAPPTIHPFHALDYVASYEDLMNALGTNDSAGFDHYIYNGRNEGRSTTFNGAEYIASYPDLINAFGADADKGTAHYITTGHVEGRTLTFGRLDYIASYGDLIKAFGADPYAGAEHYIRSGRGEGRVVSFNSLDYIASYDDLMNAFGNNGSAGATHYIPVSYTHLDVYKRQQQVVVIGHRTRGMNRPVETSHHASEGVEKQASIAVSEISVVASIAACSDGLSAPTNSRPRNRDMS